MEAPLLGKEGVIMLALWKAQMEWLANTGQLKPFPVVEDPTKKDSEAERKPQTSQWRFNSGVLRRVVL